MRARTRRPGPTSRRWPSTTSGSRASSSATPQGSSLLRESIAAAIDARQYEYAARGYCNLVELLVRGGQLDELEACAEEGLPSRRERGFWSHAYGLELHLAASR